MRAYHMPDSDELSILKDELHKVYLQDNLLKLGYQEVTVCLFHAGCTLVPNPLYHEEDARVYLSKMMPLSANDEIHIDHLPSLDSRNVYSIDKGVRSIMESYFPTARFHHATTPFLLGTQQLSQHRNGHFMYVNVLDQKMHVVLFQDRDLLFSNIFSFRATQDFLYFVLLIFDQFKLKPETMPVYLAGQIVKESEIFRMLYRYVRHIEFLQAPDYLRVGERFRMLPSHQFFDLLSLKLCE